MGSLFRCLVLCAALSSGLIATARAEGSPLRQWFDVEGSLSTDQFGRRYVPPVSSALYNETPFITTELRPMYIYHDIPDDSVVRGGYGHVVAVQARLAVTDRLGLIATKDGYTDLHFSQALPDTDGFNNIALGAKYALLTDPKNQGILTVGFEYEAPTGNLPTAGIDLAGADGDGLFDLFVTGSKGWDKFTLQGSVGTILPLDTDKNSTELHYSLHADYEIYPGVFPLLELNGLTTLDNGKVIALDLEGGDLMNIGTTDSGTVLTLAVGVRVRINDNLIAGVAWEPAISDRDDLHASRVYADLVWHY